MAHDIVQRFVAHAEEHICIAVGIAGETLRALSSTLLLLGLIGDRRAR
jgi:hypothetical protein